MKDTAEISLFLGQAEFDLLSVLPGTTESLIAQAIEFYCANLDAMPGVWGGPMPSSYPMYLPLDKDLVDRLERTGRAAEHAVRCWLNSIPEDYWQQRRALAEEKAAAVS